MVIARAVGEAISAVTPLSGAPDSSRTRPETTYVFVAGFPGVSFTGGPESTDSRPVPHPESIAQVARMRGHFMRIRPTETRHHTAGSLPWVSPRCDSQAPRGTSRPHARSPALSAATAH